MEFCKKKLIYNKKKLDKLKRLKIGFCIFLVLSIYIFLISFDETVNSNISIILISLLLASISLILFIVYYYYKNNRLQYLVCDVIKVVLVSLFIYLY